MKIAFLQETVNQNIGIMYLSALLKAGGHTCQLFVEPLENNLHDAVASYAPDLIGLSVITGSHHWALRTTRRLKKRLPRAFVILGGPHATYFPEVLQDESIDAVARGEAEISFPALVDRLEHRGDYSDIPGIWAKQKDGSANRTDVASLINDISSLPHPDRQLYLKYNFFRHHSEVPFSTTRGCPYNCAFCYNHVKATLYRGKGRYVRIRNVNDIIAEMRSAQELFPKMRSVILYDDIIGLDKTWLAEFSRQYAAQIGLPWFTSIRSDVVDEFVADKLAEARCFCLSIGLETGDEDLRTRVLGKRIPNEQYIEAARLLKARGIKVRTSNMLFLPGEDIRKALKTVDLNRLMRVDFAWAYTLQPYPGTDIYDYAVKNGYLSEAFQFDDIDPLGLLKPIVKVDDERKIMVVHRYFLLAVKSGFVRRLLNVLIKVPPNPLNDLFYSFSLILSYAEYHEVSLWRALQVAWNNFWSTRHRGARAEGGRA